MQNNTTAQNAAKALCNKIVQALTIIHKNSNCNNSLNAAYALAMHSTAARNELMCNTSVVAMFALHNNCTQLQAQHAVNVAAALHNALTASTVAAHSNTQASAQHISALCKMLNLLA